MHQKLFTLPGGLTITTYGFCLMVGFLSAVWLAMNRAKRVGADPDRVLDASFFALLFGVGGARLMYVVHYWRSDFADAPNRLLAVIDIRQGGLEFLGGVLGAAVAIITFLMITKQSVRLYLDILAPGTMWGLAFGRMGCYFNGCCFGGLCLTSGNIAEHPPWAVEFPYGSLAHVHQWEDRRVTVPAELISAGGLRASLVRASALNMPVETREAMTKKYRSRLKTVRTARAANDKEQDPQQVRQWERELRETQNSLDREGLTGVLLAQKFPSRRNPQRGMSVSELEDLALGAGALAVHPTQLYSALHALLLSAVLSTVFYRRKRHGLVIGLMFLMYPLGRIPLEMVRADNPHDVAGLTVSQMISLSSFVAAAVYLVVLYKFMPERSPVVIEEWRMKNSE